jgi:hypothetical protein
MVETDDDPVASWQDRIGSLRKRGRISAAALSVAAEKTELAQLWMVGSCRGRLFPTVAAALLARAPGS